MKFLNEMYVSAEQKTSPVDADMVLLEDSTDSNVVKKSSVTNIKAVLKTYFDTAYAAITHTHTKSQISDFPTLSTVATSGSYADLTSKPAASDVGAPSVTDYTRVPGYAVDTGTQNAMVVTLSPAPTSYVDGMRILVKIANTNTSSTITINVNGLGSKNIFDSRMSYLSLGDMAANKTYELIYNAASSCFCLAGSAMNAYKVSGYTVAQIATQSTDYTRVPEYVLDTGAPDALVVTLSPAPTSYVDGMLINVMVKYSNTSISPQINVNGLGAKTICNSRGGTLSVGDLRSACTYSFIYASYFASFILIGSAMNAYTLQGYTPSSFALSSHTQTASTITDFASTVLAGVLTGLSTATSAVIASTDSILTALGKLQAQITSNLATLTSHTGNTSNPHSVTASQVGLGAFEATATNIKTNGTQSVGTLSTVARADHVHPTDTTRAAASVSVTVTLPYGSWSGSSAPYTQTVTVFRVGGIFKRNCSGGAERNAGTKSCGVGS